MEIGDFFIKEINEKFNALDKKYHKFLIGNVLNSDDDTIDKWENYNAIIVEINQISKIYFNEFKYRVTGGEPVEDVLKQITSRFDVNNKISDIFIKNI